MVENPNAVTFAKNASLKLGKFGVSRGSLALMGLLAQGATFNISQTVRQKKDAFPEAVVAESIQSQEGVIEARLREWRKDTIAAAMGLWGDTDVTATAGGDTVVTNEPVTLNGNGVAGLKFPAKTSVALVVTNVGGTTTYVLGTDYNVIFRDLEGRTVIQRIGTGAIPAGATLEVDYTYTAVASEIYPVGGTTQVKRYFSAEFTQTLENGGNFKLWMPKASISLPSNIDLNTVDTTAELPIRITAILDPTQTALAFLENYPGAGA